MTLSAVLLGITGVAFAFLPQESAAYLSWPNANATQLQLLGATYFSFALINWTAKANLIGGIYGKPIALGNFTHFAIATLTLIKWVMQGTGPVIGVVITIIYSIFAILFGYVLFTHPKLKSNDKTVANTD